MNHSGLTEQPLNSQRGTWYCGHQGLKGGQSQAKSPSGKHPVCARHPSVASGSVRPRGRTYQAPLSVALEWVPGPLPGDLPGPGMETVSLRLLHCSWVLYH